MRIFHNFKYDFLSRRKYAYIISGSFFLVGLISVIFRGFHFGVDFTGGSEIVLQFEKPIDINNVRSYVANMGLGFVEAKTFGGETGVVLRTQLQVVPPQIYPKVIAGIDNEIEKKEPCILSLARYYQQVYR